MTDGDDGLLLYAGPLATLLPGDTEDYMAIGNCFLTPVLCLCGPSQVLWASFLMELDKIIPTHAY